MTGTALGIGLCVLAMGAIASSCGNVATMPEAPSQSLQKGLWGGDGVRLTVTEDGATLEYDCGHGSIDDAISLDTHGRFNLSGWHLQEQRGPVRESSPDQKRAARYVGRVSNDQITLSVELTDDGKTLGPFSLKHGKRVRLVKCR